MGLYVFNWPISVLGDWKDISIAHVIIIIKSEVSTFPIVIKFFRGCVPEMFVTSYSVTHYIYVPGKPGNLFSLLLCSLWWVQIFGYVLACWSYSFVCTVHHLIVRRAGLLWSQQDFEWRWSVPLFKCLIVLEFSLISFDLCLLITFFNFIMNYVPIVTFWIFTYHKIWILSIMFCFMCFPVPILWIYC